MNPASVNFDIVLANLSTISLTRSEQKPGRFCENLLAREAQVSAVAEATALPVDHSGNQLSTFPVRAAVLE
jgi:hypothetical protein